MTAPLTWRGLCAAAAAMAAVLLLVCLACWGIAG